MAWTIGFAILPACATSSTSPAAPAAPAVHVSSAVAGKADPTACAVTRIQREADDVARVWSPDGQMFLTDRKDSAGVYQIYVGTRADPREKCLTCVQHPGGPMANLNKLQAHWHPSGKWIVLGAERQDYTKDIANLFGDLGRQGREQLLQSGLWLDVYATNVDGSRWFQLQNFDAAHSNGYQTGGFTGVAFSPDGRTAVWARLVGNGTKDRPAPFGIWRLIKADFVDAGQRPRFANLTDVTPPDTTWVEPGTVGPDGRSLLISADVGMHGDAFGQDQYILDLRTRSLEDLTNSPNIWDEHGVFSPDGTKVFFMSGYPYRDDPRAAKQVTSLKTEFMLLNADGTGLQQLTHFNVPGYAESTPVSSVAAVGGWDRDGSILALQLIGLTRYDVWRITFKGRCGVGPG
jgi:Tol biopolymer transport system component